MRNTLNTVFNSINTLALVDNSLLAVLQARLRRGDDLLISRRYRAGPLWQVNKEHSSAAQIFNSEARFARWFGKGRQAGTSKKTCESVNRQGSSKRCDP